MTNLSKELCEICGIKQKTIEQYPGLNVPAEDCFTRRGYIKEVEVYPDFEHPENFVRLMELKITGLSAGNLTLMGILNKEYWICNRQDYIKFLYKYYIPGLGPYWQDTLKQAIRAEEWIYG